MVTGVVMMPAIPRRGGWMGGRGRVLTSHGGRAVTSRWARRMIGRIPRRGSMLSLVRSLILLSGSKQLGELVVEHHLLLDLMMVLSIWRLGLSGSGPWCICLHGRLRLSIPVVVVVPASSGCRRKSRCRRELPIRSATVFVYAVCLGPIGTVVHLARYHHHCRLLRWRDCAVTVVDRGNGTGIGSGVHLRGEWGVRHGGEGAHCVRDLAVTDDVRVDERRGRNARVVARRASGKPPLLARGPAGRSTWSDEEDAEGEGFEG